METFLKTTVFAIISCLASTAGAISHDELPEADSAYINMYDDYLSRTNEFIQKAIELQEYDKIEDIKSSISLNISNINLTGILQHVSQNTATYYKEAFQNLYDQVSNLV